MDHHITNNKITENRKRTIKLPTTEQNHEPPRYITHRIIESHHAGVSCGEGEIECLNGKQLLMERKTRKAQ